MSANPEGETAEQVEAGSLYRLVPNWTTHWDYERGRPEPRAFRKDRDIGVSMLLKDKISMAEIVRRKPALEPFAVCEFAIEELRAEQGVWVKPDHDEVFGDAHVLVMGITKRRIDWLRDLALKRIVKYPAPAKPDPRPVL